MMPMQPSGNEMQQATHTPPDEEDFDYDYVTPPPHNLVCAICQYPARDPIQANNCCGSTFCRGCIIKYQRVKVIDNTRCPYCNKGNFSYTKDKRAEHEIDNLMVFCSCKSLGCLWVGKLQSIKAHLNYRVSSTAGCQYIVVQCGNKCGAEMQRRLLHNHLKSECELRQVECQYCKSKGNYRWINGSHQRGCPKYPMECPNHCEIGHVRREEMSVHLEECPLAIVKCPFAVVGCDSVVRRKDITNHLETATTLHMDCMLENITYLSTEVHTTQELLEQMIDKLQGTADNTQLTYRSQLDSFNHNLSVITSEIDKIKNNLSHHDSQMNSLFDIAQAEQETSYLKVVNYSSELDSVKQDIAQKNHHLQLEIQSVQRTTSQQIQDIKQNVNDMETRHKTDLLDIKQDLTRFKEEANQKLAVVKQNLNDTFVEQKAEVDDFKKSFEDFKKDFQTYKDDVQAIKGGLKSDDAQTAEHLSQVTQQASEVQSYNNKIEVLVQLQGWHVQLNYRLTVSSSILPNIFLKMTEFTRFKKEVWYSPSFYTEDKGYKMCLSVSSHHIPSYISICVLLMRGEYDDHLHWPIKGILTLQLMNQLNDDNHTPPLDIEFDGSDHSSNCQRVIVGERSDIENYRKFIHFKNLAEDVRKGQHYGKDDALVFKVLTFCVQHTK